MTCPDATEVVVEVPITMETLILPCSPWTPTGDPMWVLHGRRFTSTMVSLPLTVSMHTVHSWACGASPRLCGKPSPCRAAQRRGDLPLHPPACMHGALRMPARMHALTRMHGALRMHVCSHSSAHPPKQHA